MHYGNRLRNNFFIFSTRSDNFKVCIRHLIYAANIVRPEHRALSNVKEGDIIFMYNMDERSLYDLFVAKQHLFKDETDIGFTKTWPHRIPLMPWSRHIGVLRNIKLLLKFIRQELITIKDITYLHQRYLNTLLYEEGTKLFKFFLRNAEWIEPREISDDFGEKPLTKEPLSAEALMKNIRESKEYLVELFLLQNISKLEEICGYDISEIYSQIYVYQQRYLDIMAIHRINNEIVKVSVVEIKTNFNENDIDRGLDELTYYMWWASEEITGDYKLVYGLLLVPRPSTIQSVLSAFQKYRDKYSSFMGVDKNRIKLVFYEKNPEESLRFLLPSELHLGLLTYM